MAFIACGVTRRWQLPQILHQRNSAAAPLEQRVVAAEGVAVDTADQRRARRLEFRDLLLDLTGKGDQLLEFGAGALDRRVVGSLDLPIPGLFLFEFVEQLDHVPFKFADPVLVECDGVEHRLVFGVLLDHRRLLLELAALVGQAGDLRFGGFDFAFDLVCRLRRGGG